MNCEPLATTGPGSGVAVIVWIAIICLIGGGVIALRSRTRRRMAGRATAALALVLVAGTALALAPVPAVHAATADCATTDNTLAVTQTSTMDAIAPGVAARPIAGLVVNQGDRRTAIVTVDVTITSVTTSSEAPSGTCDASDFALFDPRMPVGHALAAGASATFSGAAIGFVNKTTNQDACKDAVIHLLYTVNPG
jgi:hypothetical protein